MNKLCGQLKKGKNWQLLAKTLLQTKTNQLTVEKLVLMGPR